MTRPAVIDTSTLIALVRGGVYEQVGRFFGPLYIGDGAEKEARRDPQVDTALNRTQSSSPPFPSVDTLLSRTRTYDGGRYHQI